VPALALLSCVTTFFIDFAAERYVETNYGITHSDIDLEEVVAGRSPSGHNFGNIHEHDLEHNGDLKVNSAEPANDSALTLSATQAAKQKEAAFASDAVSITSADTLVAENGFRTQISAFLVLEFGVLFHSVIIGLALGSAGRKDFNSLFPVLVFHQSFEGLGIGARLSAIPFPSRWNWLPWALCAAYGLTTPIAIAVGLGLRTQYNAGSFTANVVSGVLDSLSAGILIYTGLVELLARDFLFDPKRTKDGRRLAFMSVSVLLGIFLMALLGKWA
jgi:zinc transporter 1/2/3